MAKRSSSVTWFTKSWADFKSTVSSRALRPQFEEDPTGYQLFAADSGYGFRCVIYKSWIPSNTEEDPQLAAQVTNDAAKAEFEASFKSKWNKATEPRQTDGTAVVAQSGREGSLTLQQTSNLCDKTTWYQKSTRVVEEILVDSGDGLTFTAANQFFIDLTTGKIYDEEAVKLEADHRWAVTVKVNDVLKTPRAAFATSGGDYTVNYAAGTITSVSGSWAGSTVKCSYSYAGDSTWTLVPSAGKSLDLEVAEIYFSSDMVLTADVLFQVYVYNPADLPNKVLFDEAVYKTMLNLYAETQGNQRVLPRIGGATRGLNIDTYKMEVPYRTVRPLSSAVGAELRISTRNHVTLTGTIAFATFRCVVRNV